MDHILLKRHKDLRLKLLVKLEAARHNAMNKENNEKHFARLEALTTK